MTHISIKKIIFIAIIFFSIFVSAKPDGISSDSLIYRVLLEKTKIYFVSQIDTIEISNLEKNAGHGKPIAKMKINGKCFYIFHDVDLAYEVSSKISKSPMFVLFLDLPYGKLTIDEGIYINPEIVKKTINSSKKLNSIIRINSNTNKDEKELDANDFIEAEKLRKKPIESLIILDDKEHSVYSSANKTVSTDLNTSYIIRFKDTGSDINDLLLRVSTFMILSVYHK